MLQRRHGPADVGPPRAHQVRPLAAGVVSCALLGLPATKALAAGVALYAFTLLALFLKLPARQRQPA